jgi:hypothetical protein
VGFDYGTGMFIFFYLEIFCSSVTISIQTALAVYAGDQVGIALIFRRDHDVDSLTLDCKFSRTSCWDSAGLFAFVELAFHFLLTLSVLLIVGTAVWYMGAGSGHGNPYGIVIAIVSSQDNSVRTVIYAF